MSLKPSVVQRVERSGAVVVCNETMRRFFFFFCSSGDAAVNSVPTGMDLALEIDLGVFFFFFFL